MTDRITAATKVIEEWIDRGYGNPEDNADSAARALDEAGLLAPEPAAPTNKNEHFTVWALNGDIGAMVNQHGMIIIEHMDVGWFALHPEEAGAFGDMIKAAADYSEKEEQQ